jgi:hypothetical protein
VTRSCERHGCGRPVHARNLCQRCYDAERGDARAGRVHRHRFIEQRARNRAAAALRRNHRAEYSALLRAEREVAEREVAQFGPSRLKPGPRAPDEGMTERLLELVCPRCAAALGARETCPACGIDLHVAS